MERKTSTSASDFNDDLDATGDVKYHLGAKLAKVKQTGALVEVPIVLAPNPSHLEYVNPVVVGMVRASQDIRDKAGPPVQDTQASMGILLHGDAAFPGQGVVPETLNLSRLKGYRTGGTIHIIVNNQIGYTTDWQDARSTLYASDLAKGFEIPIVHVSADDPLACLLAARMAVAYRTTFQKDFLIDVVGYRRWGHNEGDEPVFTQPEMYAKIKKHPTVRTIWADRLIADGVVTKEKAAEIDKAVIDGLAAIRRDITDGAPAPPVEMPKRGSRREVETAVPMERFRDLHQAIHDLPDGFKPSTKLLRIFDSRRALLDAENRKAGLGTRRVDGLRGDHLGRHPHPPLRPGRRARHLQPAPPRPPRRDHGPDLHAAAVHSPGEGLVRRLQQPAVRDRRSSASSTATTSTPRRC